MSLTLDQLALIRDKWFWSIDQGKLYILEKSSTSGLFTSPISDGAVNGLRVYYTAKASHFTTENDNTHLAATSELPTQFHEALCDKVISDGYKIPGDTYNLQTAQYFDQQYELQVREGKKIAKRNHFSTGTIVPVDY